MRVRPTNSDSPAKVPEPMGRDEGMPSESDLRHQVEELAMQCVLGIQPEGDENPGIELFGETLESVRRQAEALGWLSVAQTAAEFSQALSARAGQPAAQEQCIQQGLARLQARLKEESTGEAGDDPPAGTLASVAQDPEMISDFIFEGREHLTAVENQLMVLDKEPSNEEAVHTIFRCFHTIKGLAGFLELKAIREVAHEIETLLDRVRSGEQTVTATLIDAVLASADYLKRALDHVDAALGGEVGPHPDNTVLLAKVRVLASGGPGQVAAEAPAPEPEPAAETQTGPREEEPGAPAKAAEATTLRVDAGKLDYMVDMIGELMIAQVMVRHDPTLAALQSPHLQRNLSQLARITAEVQRVSMGLRMVPIGQLFRRMARLVRDLSRKSGKQVDLELAGEDTELDKTVVEELADPLMHMVRNAVDHGIESPQDRRAAGKKPTGRLTLRAYHQAGHIVVEISDDGRGLDPQKILAKARQRGLVSQDQALTEAETFHLIFEPGFSTAEQVTDVSGRGVGMDVVRKNLEKLRGRVEIQSALGRGATFSLMLPLTLAIIDGLIVGVGGQRYIVPIFAVREMFRPTQEMISTVQKKAEMVLVRGRLLPVVRLYERFRIEPRSRDPWEALLIVAESGDREFCLMVDELIGKQEVVLKSLGEMLKNVPGVSGGAILGDGRVGLILDMDGIYRRWEGV